jgi:hypothetical protein
MSPTFRVGDTCRAPARALPPAAKHHTMQSPAATLDHGQIGPAQWSLDGEVWMDLYTKIVLSVIACALSVIAWHNIAPVPAQAQSPLINRVVICDGDNPNRCASISPNGQLDVATHPGS